MAISDLFGFLDYSTRIDFDGGYIVPSDVFNNACKWVNKYKNKDGFVYPPLERRVKYDILEGKAGKRIPNTERPALLHKMPPSHVLSLDVNVTNNNSLRKADSGFIMHLLSYIFGTRIQFHDWWIDGRVPVKPTHNIHFIHSVIEDFISHSYKTWKSWHDKERNFFTNILYMYSRAPSYEWDWERFLFEYIVFDAAFYLSAKMYRCKANSHKAQFKSGCDKFGIPFNGNLIDEIYKLRNGLFHYALWGGGQPCTADNNSFMQPYNLRRFNARLLPALLGYKTPFIQTEWWHLGTYSFDKA